MAFIKTFIPLDLSLANFLPPMSMGFNAGKAILSKRQSNQRIMVCLARLLIAAFIKVFRQLAGYCYKEKFKFFIVGLLLFPVVAYSTTFNVTNADEFRQALSDAAENGGADIINLSAGTYKTTDDNLGTFVFLDNEDFDLTIQGDSSSTTILDGGSLNQVLNFSVLGPDPLITINDLSVINGYTTEDGGGIYTSENIQINDSIFDGNTGSNGGGIAVKREQAISITNSIIRNNIATQKGGGLWDEYQSHPIINDSSFTGNQSGGGGGAIHTRSSLTINNTIIRSNVAGEDGGGIESDFRGPLLISNSEISGNSAGTRGGAIHHDNSYAEYVILNTVISDNVQSGDDGVVFIRGNYGYLYEDNGTKIINSIVINNEGGLALSGNDEGTIIGNSVFSNNGSFDINIESNMVPVVKYSYVPTIIGTAITSNNISSGELGFIDIANKDFHLTESSVLIDAGTLDISCFTFPETDKDGNQRIVGTAIDIGPYEYLDTDDDDVSDESDNCPLVANPDQTDTDSDGSGNACDDDDDNDGVLDGDDAFPLDATETVDTDSDGIGNNGDNCSVLSNADQTDTDSDGSGNVCDTDDDGDGTLDTDDDLPLDATETVDTDSDGTGNNADTDDDGDGVLDVDDPYPLNAPPTLSFNYGGNTAKPLTGVTLTLTESNSTITTLTSDTNGQVKLPLNPLATNTYTLSASISDTGTGEDPVDLLDAIWILQHSGELRTLTADQLKAADVSEDGEVDLLDAIYILQHSGELRVLDPSLIFLDTATGNPLSETTFSPTDTPSITVIRMGDVDQSFDPG